MTTTYVKPNLDRVLYLYSADAKKTMNGTYCEEYRWDIPEITLNDAGKIYMVGQAYTAFAPTTTSITTRIKNVSTKYTIDTKRGDGAVLNVSTWNYLVPFNNCPAVPLMPQTINSITLTFQNEAITNKGLVDSTNTFTVILKITEDDVPETKWGNTKAGSTKQTIPIYN